MQTHLADFIRNTDAGREAEAILRKCVHCGFCTAACPTYQIRGDELDGPRGRIYLIKQVLEGNEATEKTRLHLDRCLTCRACEPACPSGVEYGRLADIGRAIVEQRVPRPLAQRLFRQALSFVLPRAGLFAAVLAIGRVLRPFLPRTLRSKVPPRRAGAADIAWPAPRHPRKMLVLAGCVQPAIAPSINISAARVLDRIGISLLEARNAGCCGALRYHLNEQSAGLDDMRALIDAWWPMIEAGSIEAIVCTASGCGVTVKDYGHLLAADPDYREKAARISQMTLDLVEVMEKEGEGLPHSADAALGAGPIAFQSPCTLQHGQGLGGRVEALLVRAGFSLTHVPDAHLCCGSAGTYSLLQPELSRALRSRKLEALQSAAPRAIATANIGCLTHLGEQSRVPVVHWVELLDRAQAGRNSEGA